MLTRLRPVLAYAVSIMAWLSYRALWRVASWQDARSNCDLAALSRLQRDGGFVVLMPSLWYSWPHAVWTPDFERFEQYVPGDGRAGRRRVPPVLFAGVWKPWTLAGWRRAMAVEARVMRRQP